MDSLSDQLGHPKQKQCGQPPLTETPHAKLHHEHYEGCLSLSVSVSLRDHLSVISGVPMMTAIKAAGSKVRLQQTTCELSLEQPPGGKCATRCNIM